MYSCTYGYIHILLHIYNIHTYSQTCSYIGQDDGYIDMEYDEDDDVDSMGFPVRKGDDDDDDDNDNGK